MGKNSSNQHLMRVRIRKNIFQRLQEAAEEEAERHDGHVTVSDIVRAACYDWLIKHESLRALEQMPLDLWQQPEEYSVLVVSTPML